MTINDVCNLGGNLWIEERLNDFLGDLGEYLPKRKVPKRIYALGNYEKVQWLVEKCEPPFTLDEINDYLIECMTP